MADQARAIQCTVAHISAVERGSQPIPRTFIVAVSDWLELSDAETQELTDLAEGKVILQQISSRSPYADAAFNKTSIERLRDLRKWLASTKHRSRVSNNDLRTLALLVRSCFKISNRFSFNALDIVENKLIAVDPEFFLQVEPDYVLGGTAAYTEVMPNGSKKIVMSESAYDLASCETPQGQFISVHELAHWVVHSETRPFLHSPKQRKNTNFSALEIQADRFVREFLLPESIVRKFSSDGQLAYICNVPKWLAAKRRLELGRDDNLQQRAAVIRKFADLQAFLRRREPARPDANTTSNATILQMPVSPRVAPPSGLPPKNDRLQEARPRRVGPKEPSELPLFEFARSQHTPGVETVTAKDAPKEDFKSMLSALRYYSGHGHDQRYEVASSSVGKPAVQYFVQVQDRSRHWFRTYGWRG